MLNHKGSDYVNLTWTGIHDWVAPPTSGGPWVDGPNVVNYAVYYKNDTVTSWTYLADSSAQICGGSVYYNHTSLSPATYYYKIAVRYDPDHVTYGRSDSSAGITVVAAAYQADLMISGDIDNAPFYADETAATGTLQDKNTDIVAGNTASYTVTVENNGTVTDDIQLTWVSTPGATAGWGVTVEHNGVAQGSPHTISSLSAGASETVYVNITSPVGAPAAEQTKCVMTADSATSSGHKDVIIARATITEPYKPDLQIKRDDEVVYKGDGIIQSTPTSAQTATNNTIVGGETAFFDIKVENDGSSDDTINITMTSGGPALSAAALFDGAIDITAQVTGVAIGAGGSHLLQLRITTPGTAQPGEKAWGIVTGTSQNGTHPVDAVNGTASIKQNYNVTVTAPAGQPGDPGATLTYTFTIKNTGNGADTISYNVDSESDWTVSPLSGSLSLGAGLSGTVNVDITIPAGTPAATTDKLWLNATCGDGVTKHQNFTTTTVNEYLQPDLIVGTNGGNVYEAKTTGAGGSEEKNVLPSAKVSFTITLENDGNTDDTFTVDRTDFMPGANWIAEWSEGAGTSFTKSLAAGGSHVFTVNITANATALDGDSGYVIIDVNSTKLTTKVDSAKAKATVATGVDISVLSGDGAEITPISCALVGNTYHVVITAVNKGTSNALNVQFTVTLTGITFTDGSTTDTTPAMTVPAGGSNTTQTTKTFTVPSGITSFTIKVSYASTDGDNTNNEVTTTVTAVTAGAAPTTSFEPTVIGIGIAVLVVAVLGTAVIWKKKKEKKKTEE